MRGAGLLGGSSLLGLGGAGAAALGAATVIGGLGGSDTPSIPPTVDDDGPIVIGGHVAGPDDSQITITGTGQPGSDVVVQIGDEVVETSPDPNGGWTATFTGDDFPADGAYDVAVTVTEPDGTETVLDGPDVVIDTAPPDTTLLDSAVDTGDIINAQAFDAGFEATGAGELGADLSVTIDGTGHDSVVDDTGDWTVTFAPGDVPPGERTTDVVVVSTDDCGNTTKITETVEIDTVPHPLDVDAGRIGGDGTVNAQEMSDGFAITGPRRRGHRERDDPRGDAKCRDRHRRAVGCQFRCRRSAAGHV